MVKATIIITCYVTLSVAGCAPEKGIPGGYISKGKDYKMYLTLRKDSSFSIYHSGFEYHKNGKGLWRMKAKDTVLLVFNDFNQNAFMLTQDYIKGDTLTLKVLSEKRLKYYKARLKKVED
nr:hypothetical protein [uncultured Mucilaginibacter sp.]